MTTSALRDSAAKAGAVATALGAVATVNTLGTVSGGAVTIATPDVAAVTKVEISADTTFTLPAPKAGKTVALLVTQDATGSRLATWSSPTGSVLAAGGTEALSTAANAVDLVTFRSYDGTNWVATFQKALAT